MFYWLPAGEELGDLSPLIADLIMMAYQFLLLLLGPLLMLDGIIEVVMVPLSALFAIPAPDVELQLHEPRDLGPLLDAPLLVDLLEDVVFLSGAESTISVQAFL